MSGEGYRTPQQAAVDECVNNGGMTTTTEKPKKLVEKPCVMSSRLLLVSHQTIWHWTRGTALRNQCLIVWNIAKPEIRQEFQIILKWSPSFKEINAFLVLTEVIRTRGSVVDWGTMVQAKGRGFDCDEAVEIRNWPNRSSGTMALGSSQPPTEMSTKTLPSGKGRPARKADNLNVICEPTV
jgi:hypothetical protein